ncbi:MAG TPA: acetyl-coenzyme A synthetase N-terminal domain-containing protein, partial [Gemmatimonadales bacterium]|nr:acetyl-coenzyme A synthetase N-terminal domain-containing protein [Gemmatimonadales bacterium]
MADQLDTLLSEERRFAPTPEFAARAAATQALYDSASRDRLAFWEEMARALDWITPWQSVLEWAPPHARW